MISLRIRQTLGAGAVALLLFGCSSSPETETTAPAEPAAAQSAEPTADPAPQESEEAPAKDSAPEAPEGTIASGAVAASANFPFPVPEGWAILEPFTPEKIGKTPTMYASVEYPGDAQEAAALYSSLLQESGFTAERYPLGEVTNQASLIASGTVNGQAYTGTMDFDVFADDIQQVAINLSEDD